MGPPYGVAGLLVKKKVKNARTDMVDTKLHQHHTTFNIPTTTHGTVDKRADW